MKERLFFEIEEGKNELLEALKNEQKYNKKIPIINENGDLIQKIVKFDVYHSYIDFHLDDVIPDYATEEPGKIQSITLYDFINNKGSKIKRIKSIIA